MEIDLPSEQYTPPALREAAENTKLDLLPKESRKKYLQECLTFKKWKGIHSVKRTTENVLIAYFNELSEMKAPSTLWAIYSMLTRTIDYLENIEIKDFSKIVPLLKMKKKVVTIFDIAGACRGGEFVKIEVDHVENHGNMVLVKIPDTKTKEPRSFTIEGNMAKIFKQYISIHPPKVASQRFLLNFQNGKCTQQVIGKHKLEKMPKQIAEYLKLDEPSKYTGHSFRRTSATLLVDAGANITTLKRYGAWKSASVAEGYIEDSLQYKRKTGSMIMGMINVPSSSKIIQTKEPTSTKKSTSAITKNSIHSSPPVKRFDMQADLSNSLNE